MATRKNKRIYTTDVWEQWKKDGKTEEVLAFIADCGYAYGSKVWDSKDKYKKTIWQCNYKFKNEHKCLTPTLNKEEIKKMFIKAYNKMIASKEEILTNLSKALNEAIDTSNIEKEIETTKEEIDKVAKEVEELILIKRKKIKNKLN